MITRCVLLLFLFVVKDTIANDGTQIDYKYLSGMWTCNSHANYPDGKVVEVAGTVVHQMDIHRYEYTGIILTYYVSDPNTYSRVTLQLSGSYELNDNEMRTESDIVHITPGPDGLGSHTKEFLLGFSENLQKPVIATLTPINKDELQSVVIETGEMDRCQRNKSI